MKNDEKLSTRWPFLRSAMIGNLLTFLLLVALSLPVWGQGDGLPRGAYQMPYTRYESDSTSQSQAQARTDYDFQPDVPAAEASSQHYLALVSDGDYAQWTVNEYADGVTLRFTIPDNSSGTGNQAALNVYVNGALDQTITLDSYWAFHYLNKFVGAGGANSPNAGFTEVRMYFDDINFKLNTPLTPGSTIRLEKTGGSSFEYGIDFIEIEQIDPVKAAPANSLSVTDAPYNANGNDQVDDLVAFHACLADANAQGKNMYIPPGKYYLDGQFRLNASNIKVQGAGIWHTELFFSSDLAFSGGVKARADNLEFSDVHITTANNDRFCPDDERIPGWNEPYKGYKGIFGTWGSYSVISNVWVEHFETGMWFADYDWAVEGASQPDITNHMLITNARIRNNYADGVNFAEGSNNCTVEHTNIRNSGDDGFAVWSSDAFGHGTPGSNNTLQFSTVENVWRAGGVAFHGADGHGVNHVLIRDGRGCAGIRFTDTFPGFKFLQNNQSVMSNITIINHGTTYDLFNEEIGAIYLSGAAGLWNVYWEDIDLINSQRHAITLEGGPYQNIEFHSLKVDGTGLDPYDHNTVVYTEGGTGIAASANGQIDLYNPQWISWETEDSIITTGNLVVNTYFTEPVGVQSVDIPDGPLSLVVGQSANLAPTFAPQNASNKSVTYSNSNSSVGTINQVTGVFNATGVGQTTITVTSDDNPAATDQVVVNVTAAINIEAVANVATEGGSAGEFVISTTELAGSLTVQYTVSGSASGGDYSASPALSGSVTLSTSSLSQSIIISATDDTEFEGAEYLTVTLVDNGNYNIGVGNATVTIADNENPPCTAPVIGYAATAPAINQNIETIWATAPAMGINNTTIGGTPGDYSGQWKALYDASNLYVLVEVGDATRTNDSGGSWWEDDVVEVFIDGDNSKGTSYDGVNDFQLGFRWNDNTVNAGGNSVQNTSGINFSMYASGSGYVLEAAIPWSTIGTSPAIGSVIGFDVAVDDDDNGGTRDAQVTSIATSDAGWTNPSIFGSIYLTDCSGSPSNQSPSANAGQDQTLPAGTTTISLTGSGSDPDNDPITYNWSQVSGPSVSIGSPASANTSVSGLSNGNTYVFRLTVNDGSLSASDDVQIVVNSSGNQAPSANAGPDQSLAAGTTTGTLNGSGIDPDSDPLTYSWIQLSGTSVTISNPGSASTGISGLSNGNSYTFRLTVDDGSASDTDDVTITVDNSTPSQSPYGGVPWAIPGIIEAENFDDGGSGVAYSDSDVANNGGQGRTGEGVDTESCSEGGLNVGWTAGGEWLEYTVSVASAGNYDFDFRVASIYSGGTFHVEFDGTNVTGTVTSENTGGWQTWTTVSVDNVALNAGQQIMRIAFDNPNHNLDKVSISTSGTGTTSVTGVSVTPTSISMVTGNTQQLSATVAPSNATNQNVTWSSDNTSVATVSSSGLVTAIAAGSATITVTTQDGGFIANSTATVTSGGGVSVYHIRNVWTNDYLQDGGNQVTYSSAASGTTFEWVLEDVGGGYMEIKNVATGEYMHIENLTGYVECTSRTYGWYSSRWAIEDAGNGEDRIRNAWQGDNYIHVENQTGQAQHGTIYTAWASAKWVLEPVSGSRVASSYQAEVEASPLRLYPVPVTNGKLYVELGDQEVDRYELISVAGVCIKNGPLPKSTESIELDAINPGIYFIRFVGQDVQITKRILVK